MIHNQLLFVVLAAVLVAVSAQNLQTCVTSGTYNSATDYFPVKSYVYYAQDYTLSYQLNYKVLTNTASKTALTYVLYQCGTPQPSASLFPANTKFFSVPVHKAWSYQDPDLSYLEALGLRTTVTGADVQGNTSPCIMKRAQLGLVTDIVGLGLAPNATNFAGNDVAFISPFDSTDGAYPVTVVTNYFSEAGLKARSEWLKFYAAFYNLENVANNLTSTIFNNTDCLSALGSRSVQTKPVIAFASNSGKYGYSVSGGTGYKKDAITFAGGVPLGTASFAASNITGFFAFLQGADILIDESYFTSAPSADQVLANYGASAANVTSMYKWGNKIFREDKLVDSQYNLDWYDSSDVFSPDIVADVMNTINSNLPVPTYQREWLRNIFTETPTVLTAAQCADPNSTTLDDFDFNCPAAFPATPTPGPRTNGANVAVVTISMMMVVLISLL